jgi:membrane-associated protease RseP (regulator of RpoE activity)
MTEDARTRDPLVVGQRPESESESEPEPEHGAPLAWRGPLAALFLTVISTFFVGAITYVDAPFPADALRAQWERGQVGLAAGVALGFFLRGWTYAVPLLSILLCHELGHFFAARAHRVPASLPNFLPLPLPPFGTLGAVIRLPARIRRRGALLDIGAAGPLCGLFAAIPITYLGLRWSAVRPILSTGEWVEEGTSLLFGAIKRLAKGPIPPGHEVVLHPTAMAGWVAMLITMLNLLPYGQLDGGHVAYALWRGRAAHLGRAVLLALPVLAIAVGLHHGQLLRAAGKNPWSFGTGYTQGINWLVFAVMIRALHRGEGAEHPPTSPEPLGLGRVAVGLLTLACGVALFMPVPLRAVSAP